MDKLGLALAYCESRCENFYDSAEVERVFYPEIEKLLLEFFPDATDALVYNHDVFDKHYEGDRTEDQDNKNPGVNANYANLVHGDRRLAFSQAWERGVRLANGVRALGLEPGDRIGVLEDNSIEAADFFHGTAIANLVRVPLCPRNSREAHHHMLNHTGCKAIMVAAEYLDEVDGIDAEIESQAHILVRDESYESWLSGQSTDVPQIDIDPEDNFIIRHTGGTTGPSKGADHGQCHCKGRHCPRAELLQPQVYPDWCGADCRCDRPV